MKNKMIDYYVKENIVAVLYNDQKLKKHFTQRNNLLSNHLKLPMIFFNDKKVLEFGPNGGENSFYLALHGAHITLVEPDDKLYQRITKLFDLLPAGKGSLGTIYPDTIESYETSEKYDYVIAEGFLHVVPERVAMIKKMLNLSSGFVIFTYSCAWGSFFESFKRFVLKKACEIKYRRPYEGLSFEKSLPVAKDFFYEDFIKLPTAREFNSWVKDILLNPCQTSETLDKFNELLQAIDGHEFEFHASSPSWDARNMLRWYKNENEETVVDNWKKNLSFFIHGKESFTIGDSDLRVIASLSGVFFDYSSNFGHISFNDVKELVAKLSNDFENVKQITQILENNDYTAAVSLYRSQPSLQLWGMPHHYLALRRINKVKSN